MAVDIEQVLSDAEVSDIQILRLQPGDTLLVNVPQLIDRATSDDIRRHVQATVGADVPVLVLADGMTLQAVRQGDDG